MVTESASETAREPTYVVGRGRERPYERGSREPRARIPPSPRPPFPSPSVLPSLPRPTISPSADSSFSSACQLVPWRRDGTVYVRSVCRTSCSFRLEGGRETRASRRLDGDRVRQGDTRTPVASQCEVQALFCTLPLPLVFFFFFISTWILA